MSPALFFSVLAVTATPDYQAALDRLVSEQDTPGVSAAISRHGQREYAGGSGFADLETSREMNADTIVYAGSLSKVFTAVLALRLVENGQLALSAPADTMSSPPIPVLSGITVHQLLTHASGLEREGDFGYWFSADFPDAAQLTRYLRRTSLRSRPGESLHYSNIGYAVLGQLIEDADDASFGDALRRLVLEPLGMQNSGASAQPQGIASGYTPVGRIIPNKDRPFAGVGRPVGDRHIREYHDAAAMTPAFGVYTSAKDLDRLAAFLLSDNNAEVLSADMRQRMRTRQASGWGLGLKIGRIDQRPVAQHNGWFAAHRSHLLLDIESGISVVVLANSDDAAAAAIAAALYRLALSAGPVAGAGPSIQDAPEATAVPGGAPGW